MKPSKSLVCLQIKSISNLMHQELAGAAHCGTMMQKMFLGYLDAHEGQPVFQKDLEAAFHIRRSTATGILQIMERDGLLRLDILTAAGWETEVLSLRSGEGSGI